MINVVINLNPNFNDALLKSLFVTRRHKRAPMSENSKHSKNNLKIYVKIFGEKNYVVDVGTILFYFMFR